jgi:hypothetical protein
MLKILKIYTSDAITFVNQINPPNKLISPFIILAHYLLVGVIIFHVMKHDKKLWLGKLFLVFDSELNASFNCKVTIRS